MHLPLFQTQLHHIVDRVDQLVQQGVGFKGRVLSPYNADNLRLVIVFAESSRQLIYYIDHHIAAEHTNDFR